MDRAHVDWIPAGTGFSAYLKTRVQKNIPLEEMQEELDLAGSAAMRAE